MDRKKMSVMIKFFSLLIIVFLLVFFVVENGKILLTNSVNEELKVTASKYLSFNYVNDCNIYKVDKENIMSDEDGKRNSDNYFDFTVTVPRSDESASYDIVINDLGNAIDERFVKVYLTDQDNKVLNNYNSYVPFYNALEDSSDGKVIYTGKITEKSTDKKFRLRIWVSDKYKERLKYDLVYKIIVKVK